MKARASEYERLCPRSCIEHAHVVASTRREPAAIRAEREAGKLRRIVAQLGEERARGAVPDVRHLAPVAQPLAILRQLAHQRSVPRIRDPDGAVSPGGDEPDAVGAVDGRVDGVAMGEREQEPARLRVPYLGAYDACSASTVMTSRSRAGSKPGGRPDLAEVQLPCEDVGRVRVELRRERRLLGDNPGTDLLQLALQPSKCIEIAVGRPIRTSSAVGQPSSAGKELRAE
jgi:hypothetical protein